MLKILSVCSLIACTALLVWWFRSGESPLDSMEGVIDADDEIEVEAKAETEKIDSDKNKSEEAEDKKISDDVKKSIKVKKTEDKESKQEELETEKSNNELNKSEDHVDDMSNKASTDGFNVTVKDLTVSGKNIRVSPFAGVGVITVNFCFKHAGKKMSPKEKEALVDLLSKSLGESTESKNNDQVEVYKREKNIHVGFSGVDDHFFISAKCPSTKLIELFALVNDLLLHAEFKESDMDRFKEELFAGLMQSMQSPESQLNELIKETVYKNHPYGVPNKTYLESLKNITADDLKKFVKSMFTQENLIVSVCGDFDEKSLTEQLEIFIETLPKKFKAELPKNVSVEGPYETHNTKFPVPQTVLKFLHTGIDHDHPDFFALQVAVGCLSDPFVGLLFKKLRVEKALVYGIGAGLAIQDHFNAFGVSTFTQTENVEKVIASVKEVFEDVCKDGFSPELVENIKQGFVGSYKRSFSSSGHIARRLANYQLTDRPVDYHKILIEKIEALTPEQINEAFKKFLNPNKFVIFTVGQ
jgi:zinc protease